MISKFPVFDAAGAVVGVGSIATDITERRAAEQALREQRTLLVEAQKLAGLGCWEWDPASGRVNWSDEMYSIYGVRAGEFRPSFESYLERIHPEDRARAAATVALALMDNRAFSMDERIVRPDGQVRQLRSHGEVVRDAAGPRNQDGGRLHRRHRAEDCGGGPARADAAPGRRPRRPSAGASRASCTTGSARTSPRSTSTWTSCSGT